MSRESIRKEAETIRRQGATVRCVDVGEQVAVILEPYALPDGKIYSVEVLDALAFLVPAIYPEAAPDASGFYVRPSDLKVKSTGQKPQATDENARLLDEPWMKFSWAPKAAPFDPTKDDLAAHLTSIEARFHKGT